MSNVKQVVQNIMDKKLDLMKENINSVMTSKAAQKLEEKKIDIAKSYFGKK